MKDSFGEDEEDDDAVRSLSISQHGNFLSPEAFTTDLSSAPTFPLHTRLPLPLPEITFLVSYLDLAVCESDIW